MTVSKSARMHARRALLRSAMLIGVLPVVAALSGCVCGPTAPVHRMPDVRDPSCSRFPPSMWHYQPTLWRPLPAHLAGCYGGEFEVPMETDSGLEAVPLPKPESKSEEPTPSVQPQAAIQGKMDGCYPVVTST